MARDIHNGMDIIDSRDVIARLKELEDERDNAKATEDTDADDLWTAENGEEFGADWTEEQEDEYQELTALAEEASGSPDWKYGETLIRRDYFETYMDEMVEDCYTLPKDMPSWMSIVLDYDALEQDYSSVDFDGQEYLIRSV